MAELPIPGPPLVEGVDDGWPSRARIIWWCHIVNEPFIANWVRPVDNKPEEYFRCACCEWVAASWEGEKDPAFIGLHTPTRLKARKPNKEEIEWAKQFYKPPPL